MYADGPKKIPQIFCICYYASSVIYSCFYITFHVSKYYVILFSLAAFSVNGLAQPYIITTIAGTNRVLDGSPSTAVPLRDPRSVAVDGAGGIYIADSLDNRIRRITPQGFMTTIAGTGDPGYQGDRGKAAAAQLNNPHTVVLDANGNVYIADYDNNVVRRISPDGIINTIAGNGSAKYGGDGQALRIGFSPQSIAVDSKGTTLYIADDSTYHILKMDLASGKITAIAGTGVLADPLSSETGPGLSCRIGIVPGMAVDDNGNLYVADATDARVRKIDANGNLTAFAGAGPYGYISDGVQAGTAVMVPLSVAVDRNGTVLIADYNRDVIFRVNPADNLLHTIAGNGRTGFSGDMGSPTQASLNSPRGLAVSPTDGAIYFADWGNSRVRKILASVITTVAGTDIRDGGPATSAFLNMPTAIAVDGNGRIAIADGFNYAVRVFREGGTIISVGDLKGSIPLATATDQSTNLYVTDDEPALLKIAPNGSTTLITGGSKDNGEFAGVAVDNAGNAYIADYNNENIRKVTPSGSTTIIAGNGNILASGDNGAAIAAGMDPFDVALDNRQNLYVADRANNRIRKIGPDGVITTVAGTGQPGYLGDGGPATAALIADPTGIAVDNAGNLYISDHGNGVVRRVTAGGLITTIAGTKQGTSPATGDGGLATLAQLRAWRVAVDAAGNVYVADRNDLVRKLTPKIVTPSAIKVTGGNNQTATTGTTLKIPLTVQVVDATGAGVPGVVVTFTVNPSKGATLSPPSAITLNDGTATSSVTLGNTAGAVTITAAAAGVSSTATFTLTATPSASSTAPFISSGGVVSAGLSVPAVKVLAPNAIASVFGSNFAPAGTAKQVGNSDLVNGKIPTVFAGVCVQVGGQRAPIFAVFPTQINFQVPASTPGSSTVQVTTGCDGTTPQTSSPEPVSIQAAAPEFFYFANNADGHNPIAAINAVTGAYIGPSFTTAKPGDILTLFATGFGATNPSLAPGELPVSAATVNASVAVTFGSVTLAASDILYAGVVGGNAGLYQLNVRVPDAVPDGDQPVVITIGATASPAKAFITVAR